MDRSDLKIQDTAAVQRGSWPEVFRVFLQLGLTSFGGPIAHLAYFRDALVVRRNWLGETAYAELVALCQFLPGPTSSQVGMGLGLLRAGFPGLVAAWVAFTLPSALLLVGFAAVFAATQDADSSGWILGLKAAAAGVVAHAIVGMGRSLTPDLPRLAFAALAAIAALALHRAWMQPLILLAAGLVGVVLLRESQGAAHADGLPALGSRRIAVCALLTFAALLILLPLLAASTNGSATHGVWQLADPLYRAGSLVFGGGHAVLPLLQAEVVGSQGVDAREFLAGYGAAQAIPGPLFSFAAYLGAVMQQPPHGLAGAAIALVAIFLPAALLLIGVLPFWHRVRGLPSVRRALLGVNAAVVGLLAAVFYDPVLTVGVGSVYAALLALAAFAALSVRWPAWLVVVIAAGVGQLIL